MGRRGDRRRGPQIVLSAIARLSITAKDDPTIITMSLVVAPSSGPSIEPVYEPPPGSLGRLWLRGHHDLPQSSEFPELDEKGVSLAMNLLYTSGDSSVDGDQTRHSGGESSVLRCLGL